MQKIYYKIVFRIRERINSLVISSLRRAYWSAMGLRIGKKTNLPRIFATWPHQVSIGDRCVLEQHIYFKFDGIYADGPSIVIKDDVFIGAGCEFNIRRGINVGSNCLIASNCYFVDHDHGFKHRSLPIAKQADGVEAPIQIEDDVWIGANVTVLKGVTLAKGSIIAAGSVVNKSTQPYEIWGGVPAKKIGDRPNG